MTDTTDELTKIRRQISLDAKNLELVTDKNNPHTGVLEAINRNMQKAVVRLDKVINLLEKQDAFTAKCGGAWKEYRNDD